MLPIYMVLVDDDDVSDFEVLYRECRNKAYIIAYKILKKEFEDKQYPFEMTPQMQAIEFVASNAQYRRKGVASEIIKHIIKEDHHTVFVLEVADTNTSAVSLYKKMPAT